MRAAFGRYGIASGVCAGLLALSIATPTALWAQAPAYTFLNLGTLGGPTSEAMAVNNLGQVAGRADLIEEQARPFQFTDGVMTALTADFGWATGINDSGQVAGFALLPGNGNVHAFIYKDGVLTDLGTLPGEQVPYSTANAINNAGTVVGDSKTQAMIYRDGVMAGLSKRAARTAYGVNDDGWVVGMLSGNNTAFLFDGRRMMDLGALDGSNAVSAALAINARGQVVGHSYFAGNAIQHAFLYENGVMRDLGTLRGGYSIANAINAHGDIVGESDGSAFLYRDGVMIDLNSLIAHDEFGLPHLNRARAISDNGHIVGLSFVLNEGARAFLLTPLDGPPTP